MKPKPYHHGDLHTALLECAAAQLAREGREALSLRRVAETVGVTPAAIYRHFASKEALLAALAAEGFQQLTTALQTVFNEPLTPLQRFRRTGDIYAGFARQHRQRYALMYAPDLLNPAYPAVVASATAAFEVLLESIRQCQAAGDIRAGDLTAQAFSIYAAAHGTVALCLDSPPPFCPQATLERGMDLIWATAIQGLLAR